MMPSLEDPTRLISMRDAFIAMQDDFKTLSWQTTKYHQACFEREQAAVERYEELKTQNSDIQNELRLIHAALTADDDNEETE